MVVVVLGAAEVGKLTLAEWDELRGCSLVWFEVADHPLRARLETEGVSVEVLGPDADPAPESAGLVAEPSSDRLIGLAHSGARILVGPAEPQDDLTAAHAAPIVRGAAQALGEAVAIMARLRSDDGCPWDREQTHESLKVHLLEETYEVLDAIDRADDGASLQDELGDVLLQVAFHSRLAEQEGRFDISDVARGLVAKLVNRHPHVFGDVSVGSADEVVRNWESIKAVEKGNEDPFAGIPDALPALLAAHKIQKRAAGRGFDGDEDQARAGLGAAIAKEMDPIAVGEALFWLVAIARARGVEPESALRTATERFKKGLG